MTLLKNGSAEPIYSAFSYKIYCDLIQKRIVNPAPEGVYCEKHHITPQSLGGSDDPENRVRLTAREHFIAHCLLARIYPKNSQAWFKMHLAIDRMKNSPSPYHKRYVNSRLYAAIKRELSLYQAECKTITDGKKIRRLHRDEEMPNGFSFGTLAYVGDKIGNSKRGNLYIRNILTDECKTIKKWDSIPEGWEKGMSRALCAKRSKISSDLVYLHNVETGETKKISGHDPIPDGWERGISSKARDSLSSGKKGKIVIHNQLTQEQRFHPKNKILPEGWIAGLSSATMKARTEMNRNKLWCHNCTTGETRFVFAENVPPGWTIGQSSVMKTKVTAARAEAHAGKVRSLFAILSKLFLVMPPENLLDSRIPQFPND